MAICLVPVWAYLAVNQLLCKRKISFQTAAGVIESTTTDWRFRSKTHRYRFEEFHCVRTNLCYVGSKPRCRVELVRKLDGKVLVIAHFPPTTTRSGLFSRWLTKTEPPNAAALRKKLHALMGILDWGYRDGWTGEEITGD
ncbi:MAG: hypothetical protein KF796_18610 [Ramlibacter sp.]|nr:hypothetical protein [Ramlibacter sp.]